MITAATLTLLLATNIPQATAASPTNNYLSRADAVELILRASREVILNLNYTTTYPDVIGTEEEIKYLRYAIKLKMLDPEPERGLIFPYRSVSRSEFLKMIVIAFNLPLNIPHAYTDVDNDSWYMPYAGIASSHELFVDAPYGGELKPMLRVTEGTALRALEKLFLKEPYLKPKNFSFAVEEAPPNPSRIMATPKLVKETVIRLFKKQGIEPPEKTRHEVIALLNHERANENLQPLKENLQLRQSAQNHAADMKKRGYFSHTTPEGLDYVDRIKNANYLYVDQSKCGCRVVINLRALIENDREETNPGNVTVKSEVCGCKPHFAVGENIAKGQLTAKGVMRDWMNSPPHRANIMHPQFEEVGIGIFGDVWVQNFGRKRIE